VIPSADPGAGGNLLFGVNAVSTNSVYAVGQRAGSAFPDQLLVEHWDGKSWSVQNPPADAAESLLGYAVTGSDTSLTAVGDRATDTAPFTTLSASGTPSALTLESTPNQTGENNLYAATTAADSTVYASGWSVDPATGVYLGEILHRTGGTWSLDTAPSPGSGSNGYAGIGAIPGGGVWAVGVTSNKANNSTLIAHHC